MLSIQNLSIGNLLFDKNKKNICAVSNLDTVNEFIGVTPVPLKYPFDQFNVMLQGAEYNITLIDLEPLRLTKELVQSMGFDEDLAKKNVWVSYNKRKQAIFLLFPKNEIEQSIGIFSIGNKEVKFVHELQNSILESEGDLLDIIED